MAGNFNATADALSRGMGEFSTTSALEMAAFDMLPVTLRRALHDAPYSMASEEVLRIHIEQGWQATLREIESSAAQYVGEDRWRPMMTGSGLTSSRGGRRASAIRCGVRGQRNLRRLGLTLPTVAEYWSGASR
jgi:hypothetical protein